MMEIETTKQFKKIMTTNTHLIVVDFSAVWCGPCKALKPILELMSVEYKENKKDVEFFTIDIDKCKSLTKKFLIHSVPTILFFKDGKKLNEQVSGLNKKEKIQEILNKLL